MSKGNRIRAARRAKSQAAAAAYAEGEVPKPTIWDRLWLGLLNGRKVRFALHDGPNRKARRRAIARASLVALACVVMAGCETSTEPGSITAQADASGLLPSCHDACHAEGLCTPTPNGCFAATVQDCRPSLACWNEGRCDARDGVCVKG